MTLEQRNQRTLARIDQALREQPLRPFVPFAPAPTWTAACPAPAASSALERWNLEQQRLEAASQADLAGVLARL